MDSDRRLARWLDTGAYQGVIGGGVMFIFVEVALMAGFPVPLAGHPILLILLAVAIGFFGGRLIGGAVIGSSGSAAAQFYMPQGGGSTYTTQYSHIDTLEARGNLAGAVDAWEKVAIAEPANPWPLIRAGELYMRTLADPAMALERFKVAREVPSITIEHRLYTTQKIVDLYLGPLNDKGRALVELRRMVDTFPDRKESQFAREAIARLKSAPEADPFAPG
jgi:hypothetical protein